MMTIQTPTGTWNPTVPTNGANGHTRLQDAVAGVNPSVYGYASIPTGIPQTYGTVNPYIQATHPFGATQAFGQINPFATLNPLAQSYATSFQTTPYSTPAFGVTPNLGYATAWNQPAAIHPFALAYSQTTPFGGFVNPLVNPFVQAIQSALHPTFQPAINSAVNPVINSAINATINPSINPAFGAAFGATINPVSAVNPFATVNPFQAINPFVAAAHAVSPFVSGCLGSHAVNPWINTLNTIPQTLANNVSSFGLGLTNPVIAQQIAHATLANAATCCGTTVDPVTGSVVPVTNFATGSFPYLAGQSSFLPFGLGVSPFHVDSHLGLNTWGNNIWNQHGIHGWTGHNPLQTIAWQQAAASRFINPLIASSIHSNPFTNPFVNPFTSPFVSNTITPWASQLNSVNPYLRNLVNHSFGLCGLNPLNPTNCIC